MRQHGNHVAQMFSNAIDVILWHTTCHMTFVNIGTYFLHNIAKLQPRLYPRKETKSSELRMIL